MSTPPAARATRAAGSTDTAFISDRSIITPSSRTAWPTTECPPPRTEIGSSRSRANRTPARRRRRRRSGRSAPGGGRSRRSRPAGPRRSPPRRVAAARRGSALAARRDEVRVRAHLDTRWAFPGTGRLILVRDHRDSTPPTLNQEQPGDHRHRVLRRYRRSSCDIRGRGGCWSWGARVADVDDLCAPPGGAITISGPRLDRLAVDREAEPGLVHDEGLLIRMAMQAWPPPAAPCEEHDTLAPRRRPRTAPSSSCSIRAGPATPSRPSSGQRRRAASPAV